MADFVAGAGAGAGAGAIAAAAAGKTLNLISSEGTSFNILVDRAMMSELVKTAYDEDAGEDGAPQDIPLPNLTTSILDAVVKFINQYATDPMTPVEKPLKSASVRDMVQEWYATFINLPQEQIFELMLAANYLDLKPLLDLTCAAIALKIKGRTPDEIKAEFNITDDWTPEEEAQMRAENKWCEEI
jgi:S-phase kinase-associated protein 1